PRFASASFAAIAAENDQKLGIMEIDEEASSEAQAPSALSNAESADRLAGLAQLLSTQKENPYKVKAYHRAAARIRSLSDSLDELVRADADLTQFPGIGEAIASAIREVVLTGKLRKLETLCGQAAPEIASLADYPRLDHGAAYPSGAIGSARDAALP